MLVNLELEITNGIVIRISINVTPVTVFTFAKRRAVACEQAHLYQEPAKRGKVWVKRGKVSLHVSY